MRYIQSSDEHLHETSLDLAALGVTCGRRRSTTCPGSGWSLRSSLMKYRPFFLAGMLASCFLAACNCGHVGQVCSTTSDCPTSEACVNGTCSSPVVPVAMAAATVATPTPTVAAPRMAALTAAPPAAVAATAAPTAAPSAPASTSSASRSPARRRHHPPHRQGLRSQRHRAALQRASSTSPTATVKPFTPGVSAISAARSPPARRSSSPSPARTARSA